MLLSGGAAAGGRGAAGAAAFGGVNTIFHLRNIVLYCIVLYLM